MRGPGRTAGGTVAVILAAALTGACAKGSTAFLVPASPPTPGNSPSASEAPSVSPESPSPSPSFESPVPTEAPSPSPTFRATSPEQAATLLYAAWKASDRSAAGRVASPAAVDELFARPWTGPDLQFMGCSNESTGTYLCSWYYEGGAMQMTVQGGASAGWFVENIGFIAD